MKIELMTKDPETGKLIVIFGMPKTLISHVIISMTQNSAIMKFLFGAFSRKAPNFIFIF
jgi:hypothetical protein